MASAKAKGRDDISAHSESRSPALGQPPEAWRSAVDSRGGSIFSITDALAYGMIERQWGRIIIIIIIGSSGIERPIAGFALSKAVRAAVAGWSKTLSTQRAPHWVTVNMILPGRSDTDRVRVLDDIRARNIALELAAVQEASRTDIPRERTSSIMVGQICVARA
ncbi:SDR family NAD(P)-dependent oxidoreductase [Agrobacterium tumefaciens]|uniref:SDR family NAD(P)-dependent oxidoreductase n=1 Tax=Agrobacterium tumefaciens TaxID=358 RepID=UPI0015746399|nr:SDR family NAD(P)-dependent oxidoreductase [Agrobacterium tumefaciens]NTA45213.1 SDR family NAD(P)-dependent oxidoreductase [Agrobacterium tumefaciens]WIE33910.1 SDR family NAD(P)-dependent oxidoreductase [Agrobacterium tumefaciens]